MKVTIINKSDSTGGAAVVSYRLMEALRNEGVDARMLVGEKLTDSPYVKLAASPSLIKRKFLKERLKIFLGNGMNRSTLFKIDTGDIGLALWKHPLVKDADAIILGWINQGILSLNGIKKIRALGKPIIWAMHDLWCMTGICHHPYDCNHYQEECGDCPLLGKKRSKKDLSYRTWKRKNKLYGLKSIDIDRNKKNSWSEQHNKNKRPVRNEKASITEEGIKFVAVSNWLALKAKESSLLSNKEITVIPNPVPSEYPQSPRPLEIVGERIRILMGAARLDDPIKGFDIVIKMTEILKKDYPALSEKLELVTFGNIKDINLLKRIKINNSHKGLLRDKRRIRKLYETSHILLSASLWETLPTTLVEAQLYGCIPVSFNRGGQSDIVDHLSSGYLAQWNADPEIAARRLAEGIAWAAMLMHTTRYPEIQERMWRSAVSRFRASDIAKKYLKLMQNDK